jgi:hypothetical protein
MDLAVIDVTTRDIWHTGILGITAGPLLPAFIRINVCSNVFCGFVYTARSVTVMLITFGSLLHSFCGNPRSINRHLKFCLHYVYCGLRLLRFTVPVAKTHFWQGFNWKTAMVICTNPLYFNTFFNRPHLFGLLWSFL